MREGPRRHVKCRSTHKSSQATSLYRLKYIPSSNRWFYFESRSENRAEKTVLGPGVDVAPISDTRATCTESSLTRDTSRTAANRFLKMLCNQVVSGVQSPSFA